MIDLQGLTRKTQCTISVSAPTNNFGKTTRKWAWRVLSGLVLAAFAWQFWRLGKTVDWSAFGAALARPGQWRYLVLALLLMPVNWWLEAQKFHLLLRPFLPWDLVRSVRTVLAGVSLSAATPNRIGEIGGRLLVAKREEWPGVLTASVLGSACQWIAFLLLAWPGLLVTAGDLLAARLPFPVGWLWPLGPVLLLIGLLGGKPFLLRIIRWAERRFKLAESDLRRGLTDVKFGLILRAGGYACARFFVYCTQLWLLLWFFGLRLPVVKGLAGIMGIYLVQAGIPLPPGLNLVTRTELGLLLWGDVPVTALAILLAFTSLFAINVLLPALPGYWLITTQKKLG
ncbi:MAG: lysylphosphatidylglycerol synthase domain-containing protein [Bacteroidota bacterium]